MSRSYRHTKICSHTKSGFNTSEKDDKCIANRKFRRVNKQRVSVDKDPVDIKEVSDVWGFKKDGKGWVGDCPQKIIDKIMRK